VGLGAVFEQGHAALRTQRGDRGDVRRAQAVQVGDDDALTPPSSARATSSSAAQRLSRSTSMKNGSAPMASRAVVVYMPALATVAPRSPAATPSAFSPSSIASVPLATPMHSRAPR